MSAEEVKLADRECHRSRVGGASALAEIFNNPLDPHRSIQLNNRYWPGARFTILAPLNDAEQALEVGDLPAAARALHALRKYFDDRRFFRRLIYRLHKLRTFRSGFGYQTGKIDVPQSVLAANRYGGAKTRESYPLAMAEHFATLIEETGRLYKAQYGADLVRMNCTVRFAEPDERQVDITRYGPLSDYHNDEYKGITSVIYLSEVSEENGPFSYIEGSHLIPRSLVLTAIHHVVEFDMGFTVADDLTRLPLEFRGSAAIGNFLDRDKVDLVVPHCRVLAGGIGTYITFNGQYLMHRGGKPLSAQRTAAFIQPEGRLRHKLGTVRSLIFGRLHS